MTCTHREFGVIRMQRISYGLTRRVVSTAKPDRDGLVELPPGAYALAKPFDAAWIERLQKYSLRGCAKVGPALPSRPGT